MVTNSTDSSFYIAKIKSSCQTENDRAIALHFGLNDHMDPYMSTGLHGQMEKKYLVTTPINIHFSMKIIGWKFRIVLVIDVG